MKELIITGMIGAKSSSYAVVKLLANRTGLTVVNRFKNKTQFSAIKATFSHVLMLGRNFPILQ